MTWDPFFLQAELGISIWFEFMGRHEIGVDLQVHTPDFGGIAHISLFFFSFDIEFGGDPNHGGTPIGLADFITRHIGVTATGFGIHDLGASLPCFNTADQPGLLRLQILSGRSTTAATQGQSPPPAGSTGSQPPQEGITGSPIQVQPEFSFKLHSRLPLDQAVLATPAAPAAVSIGVTGSLKIPLCNIPSGTAKLTLKAVDPRGPTTLSRSQAIQTT